MFYAIRYHLYNLKTVKNNHGRVLLLVKLQALACNFTKRAVLHGCLLRFLNLHKLYHIAQRITNKKDSWLVFRFDVVTHPWGILIIKGLILFGIIISKNIRQNLIEGNKLVMNSFMKKTNVPVKKI